MNLADQFKNVNWKDLGNAAPAPKVLAMLFLLAAVIGAGWYLYWNAKNEELDAAKVQESKLKDEFKAKKQKAVNLPELKKQLAQVGQYVSTLEKQLPSKAEMDALLTDINQAGLGRGLQFDLFRPSTVNVKEYYAEQPIAVRVTGNYHDLGAFASDIANLGRIVTLNDVSITAPATSGPLALETTAKTFRYLDPEEVAMQRKSKQAAGGAKK